MDHSSTVKQSAISRVIPSFLQSRENQYLPVASQDPGAIALPDSDDEGEAEGTQTRKRWSRRCCTQVAQTCRGIVKRWGIKTILLWSSIISLIIGLLVFGICMAVIRPNRYNPGCYYPIIPHTGLENMPKFGSSLDRCYIYPPVSDTQKLIKIPIGKREHDHAFTVLGNGSGTITIAGAPVGVEEVVYDFTVSAKEPEGFKFHYPEIAGNGTTLESRLTLETPRLQPGYYSPYQRCSRYSVTIYVPANLRSLSLLAETTTHIQFSPGSPVELDLLNITVTSDDRRNLILPHTSIRSQRLVIEAAEAWVVGSVSLVKEVSIASSYNYGVTSKVEVHPSPPTDLTNPEPAILRTWSGYGNMSIAYIGSASYIHRPIDSKHVGIRGYGGQMSLEYTGAKFNGLLDIRAGYLLARGISALYDRDRKFSEYTHSVGDRSGADRMVVKSASNVNIWFPGDYLRNF